MSFFQKFSWFSVMRTLHLSEVWTWWLRWILVPICKLGRDIKRKIYLNFTQPRGTKESDKPVQSAKKSDKPVQSDKVIYICMYGKNTPMECLIIEFWSTVTLLWYTQFTGYVLVHLNFIHCFSNHLPSERKVACHVCTFQLAATRE